MTKLLINSIKVPTFTFSGGEVNPRIPDGVKAPFEVTAWLQSSDDIMNLIMLHDAIKRQYGKSTVIYLTVPYLPYARQDRVCTTGEALGLHTLLELLGRFSSITSYDIHNSDAITGYKVHEVTLHDIVRRYHSQIMGDDNYILVAPDKGATENVESLASGEIIYGSKIRDPRTGKLTGFGFSTEADCEGKDLLLIDDICDGGGTFIGLAEKLKELKPKSMSLYVTHGIFSKGIEDLLNVFDNITTTNTFIHPYGDDERITTIKVI
jgi:ribose-phosphate pyrophosphokinase